jgi:hypothetical protein
MKVVVAATEACWNIVGFYKKFLKSLYTAHDGASFM